MNDREGQGLDRSWRIGRDESPLRYWRTPRGQLVAHLYAYADPDDPYGDPDLPRCNRAILRSITRPARFPDRRCPDCTAWYDANVAAAGRPNR